MVSIGYIMEKLKKRGGKYYILDWIFDIILALTFIYLSFQVRNMVLTCQNNPYNITNLNITPFNPAINSTIYGMVAIIK